eukprot:580901_1
MSLEVEFHGRVSSPLDFEWEQMFRLGWPSYSGGPLGALSRYPSLWLDNAADVFHFGLSHSENSGWGKDFNQLTLVPTQTYSVHIEWNSTWVYFSVNDNVFLNTARNYPTTTQYIGRLLNVYIASDSFAAAHLVVAGVTLRNINISTIPPTASPTIATTFPTQHPTINPTLSPTTQPTYHPTLHPSSAAPSLSPTYIPSAAPTSYPTLNPSITNTLNVSHTPTAETTTVNQIVTKAALPPDTVLNTAHSDLIYLAVAGCAGCMLCCFMMIMIVKSTKKAKLQQPKQREMACVERKGSEKSGNKTPTTPSQRTDRTKHTQLESEAYDAYGLSKEERTEIINGMDNGTDEDGEDICTTHDDTSNVRDHETETEMDTELDYIESEYDYADNVEYDGEVELEPHEEEPPLPAPEPQPPQISIQRRYCMSEELEQAYLKRVMEEVVVIGRKKSPPPPKHHSGRVGFVDDAHRMARIIDDNDSDNDTLKNVPMIPDGSHGTSKCITMDEESITMLEVGYEWITLVLLEIDVSHWREYVDNFKHHGVTESRLGDLRAADLEQLIPNTQPRNEFQLLLANKLGRYHD